MRAWLLPKATQPAATLGILSLYLLLPIAVAVASADGGGACFASVGSSLVRKGPYNIGWQAAHRRSWAVFGGTMEAHHWFVDLWTELPNINLDENIADAII